MGTAQANIANTQLAHETEHLHELMEMVKKGETAADAPHIRIDGPVFTADDTDADGDISEQERLEQLLDRAIAGATLPVPCVLPLSSCPNHCLCLVCCHCLRAQTTAFALRSAAKHPDISRGTADMMLEYVANGRWTADHYIALWTGENTAFALCDPTASAAKTPPLPCAFHCHRG